MPDSTASGEHRALMQATKRTRLHLRDSRSGLLSGLFGLRVVRHPRGLGTVGKARAGLGSQVPQESCPREKTDQLSDATRRTTAPFGDQVADPFVGEGFGLGEHSAKDGSGEWWGEIPPIPLS